MTGTNPSQDHQALEFRTLLGEAGLTDDAIDQVAQLLGASASDVYALHVALGRCADRLARLSGLPECSVETAVRIASEALGADAQHLLDLAADRRRRRPPATGLRAPRTAEDEDEVQP